MVLRTMRELARDLAQHEVSHYFGLMLNAIENKESKLAGRWAAAVVRNTRRLRSRQVAVDNEQRAAARRRLHLRMIEIDRAYADDNGLRVDLRSEVMDAAKAA